jgi:dienelactone hydrolase
VIAPLLFAAAVAWNAVQFPSKDGGLVVSARLYAPANAGPRPAVVVMHTCAGIDDTLDDWSSWLAQNGYMALEIDSFGPRHTEAVCGTHDVPPRTRALDAAGALAYLQSRPDVIASRIGILGFSHGGGSVLWSESESPGYRAGVALYPNECDSAPRKLAFPLLILIGGYDDWTPASDCRYFVSKVDPAGAPGSIYVYPKAYHKFDDPQANRVAHVGHHDYTLRYDPDAAADAHARVLAFFAAM